MKLKKLKFMFLWLVTYSKNGNLVRLCADPSIQDEEGKMLVELYLIPWCLATIHEWPQAKDYLKINQNSGLHVCVLCSTE
jgi:hypothetical protein